MAMTVRRLFRWGALALGLLAVVAGTYLSVFFLPYPLFRHHATAAGFSVYCDRELPEDLGPALDDARRRIESMPLYRGDPPPRIFICRSQGLFEALVRLAGKRHAGVGLLISAAHNAFFSETTLTGVAARSSGRPRHSRLEGLWSAAIAHEAAHQLVADELGCWRSRRLPAWKSEGYADYSANIAPLALDPEADLASRVAFLRDDEAWQGPTGGVDRRHFRWQLEVEYLCTVRGLDFAALLADDVTEAETWAALVEWQARTAPSGPDGAATSGTG